ncbi:MAG: hypothetical protein R3B84_11585 [Zavarzinella sp.]
MMTSLVVGLTLVLGAPPPEKLPAESILGDWQVTEVSRSPKSDFSKFKLNYIFGKDSFVLSTEFPNGKSDVQTIPYKLNRKDTHWEIDFTVHHSDSGFHKMLGRIEIKGDELKFCFAYPLSEKMVRPDGINTKNGNTIHTMKRVKSPAKK